MALRGMPAEAASNLPPYTHTAAYMRGTLNRVHTEQFFLPGEGTLSFPQYTLKMTVATESLKIITPMGEEFVLHCSVSNEGLCCLWSQSSRMDFWSQGFLIAPGGC